MDDESKLLAGGIALFATATGIWEWVRRVNRTEFNRERRFEEAQELSERHHIEVIAALNKLDVVSEHLEDVLLHPAETQFSNKEVEARQSQIMKSLERIERGVKK